MWNQHAHRIPGLYHRQAISQYNLRTGRVFRRPPLGKKLLFKNARHLFKAVLSIKLRRWGRISRTDVKIIRRGGRKGFRRHLVKNTIHHVPLGAKLRHVNLFLVQPERQHRPGVRHHVKGRNHVKANRRQVVDALSGSQHLDQVQLRLKHVNLVRVLNRLPLEIRPKIRSRIRIVWPQIGQQL